MIGFFIGSDLVRHSSFVPHSDLVILSMNRWFTVNLFELIGGVSTTPSSSSPSFHHVTEGLGIPETNCNLLVNKFSVQVFFSIANRAYNKGGRTVALFINK